MIISNHICKTYATRDKLFRLRVYSRGQPAGRNRQGLGVHSHADLIDGQKRKRKPQLHTIPQIQTQDKAKPGRKSDSLPQIAEQAAEKYSIKEGGDV